MVLGLLYSPTRFCWWTRGNVVPPFSFRLTRYKDDETHEESLEIKSLLNSNDNGSIMTAIYDLERDLKGLMRFGVVLDSLDLNELSMVIKSSYLNLPMTKLAIANDERLTSLIELVKEYVRGDADLITEDFCYICVNMFNDLALDCGYSNYELKALRSMLVKGKYIYTQAGRYAVLKRIKDKPERVLAFYRKKIKVEVPVKQKKNQSGATEKK